MNLNYNKTWESMNSLQSVTSKICSALDILDSAIDALNQHKLEKAETLMYAVDEYLKYYLEEFNSKFKDAWKETVTKLSTLETKLTCDKNNSSPECKSAWNDFWEENYYPEEVKNDKVKRWVLPVEETKIEETDETEYFITFPDDLLEAANLKEGDTIEWVDNKDGSYTLKKVPQTYDEMIAAGYTMTADGFWIKE